MPTVGYRSMGGTPALRHDAEQLRRRHAGHHQRVPSPWRRVPRSTTWPAPASTSSAPGGGIGNRGQLGGGIQQRRSPHVRYRQRRQLRHQRSAREHRLGGRSSRAASTCPTSPARALSTVAAGASLNGVGSGPEIGAWSFPAAPHSRPRRHDDRDRPDRFRRDPGCHRIAGRRRSAYLGSGSTISGVGTVDA